MPHALNLYKYSVEWKDRSRNQESRKDGRSKGSISLRGLWTVPARVSAHHLAWRRLFESERYGDVESAEGKE